MTAHADLTTVCKDHYVAARFETARRCFRRALAQMAGQPAQICEAYVFIAATELGEEDSIEARRAVSVAMAIDPTYDPVDPLLHAPRVRDLLSVARADAGSGRPTLLPSDPDATAEGAVLFSVRAENVRSPLAVHLNYRFAGSTHFRHALLPEAEPGTDMRVAAVPRLRQADAVEYAFSVETPEGAVVVQAGTLETPLSRALGPALRRHHRGGSGVSPWYGRWWFWTGVGLVATGAVLSVLLLQGDEQGAIHIEIE